ncbi:MAG: cell wall hydrolase [Burkholderiales bacterium]
MDKLPLVVVGVLALCFGALAFFTRSVVTEESHKRDLACLALNVYHEARGEPLVGQYAVAEVTMNRVNSARYPDTVCEVVYQKNWDPLRGRYVGAFSWTEFDSVPRPEGEAWQQAMTIAQTMYYGKVPPMLKGALHYHAVYIKPSWAKGKRTIARIGKHIFYP